MRTVLVGLTALAMIGASALTPVARAAEDTRSTVSVVGDGQVLVQPDVAHVGFGVESVRPTLVEAQADANARIQAVIGALTGQGIAQEDIRTTRIDVSPVYDQRDSTILRGYRVTNAVQATVRAISNVGPAIDAATAAGANRVNSISFGVDNLNPFKDQARALAFANARAKAEQLASLAGMQIVGVKSISESDASSTPVRTVRAAPEAAPASMQPTPVEPGQQEVRTHVSVTFILG